MTSGAPGRDRIALAAAILLASATAAAQTEAPGFALDRFEPSAGGSDWFTLESLDFRGHARLSAGLLGEWASKPLVLYDRNGQELEPVVDQQLFLHAVLSVNLWDRLRLGASLPVAVHQPGTTARVGNISYPAAGGGALGDVRLAADIRVIGEPGGPFVLALGSLFHLPTGKQDRYTGDGKLRASPRLLLAGDVGPVAWAARLGVQVRPAIDRMVFQDVGLGTELGAGASLGLRPTPDVLIGPEVYAASALVGDSFLDERATPLELLLGAHFRILDDWHLSAGVAPGLTQGIGTPKVRVLARLAYFPAIAGPSEPPPPRRRPPPPAPEAPAPAPEPPPPDRDKDGVLDKDDACPDVPGLRTDSPLTNGCADKDMDGILDPEDACPDVAGPKDPDPKKNGCPVARVERGQIRILEQVKFRFNSAEILPESDSLLTAVAKVLADNPDLKKVRVEGHTDNRGTARYNKKLSDRRAASVVRWLVGHGVERGRLTSEGFGPTRPIATNKTEEGRQENRRVEFHIVDPPQAETP